MIATQSTASSRVVRSPAWQLVYQGRNIAADISRMVISLSYTDHKGGVADDAEITVEDSDRKWQGPWFPAKGDLLTLQIGYANEPHLPCGSFQVDEVALEMPPDRVTLRCLAAFITPSMRTPNNVSWEGQSLTTIAGTIAAKYGLQVIDVPNPLNMTFEIIGQHQETDLAFLHRLAEMHNYDFNVRGGILQFYARTDLEAQAPVFDAVRGVNVERASFKSKTHETYKAAEARHWDPNQRKLITATALASPPVATGDTYKIDDVMENGQQAMLKAQSAIHGLNRLTVTAQIGISGDIRAVSGNTFNVSGFGQFDGKYIIDSSRHRLARGTGYSTEIEAYSVPDLLQELSA